MSLYLGLSLLLAVVGIPYGPAAAYLPELFQTRYRYTGAGTGYNLAGILGGALPLIVAPPIFAAYGGIGVGFYLTALALLSTLCVLALSETRNVVMDGPLASAARATAGAATPRTPRARPGGRRNPR